MLCSSQPTGGAWYIDHESVVSWRNVTDTDIDAREAQVMIIDSIFDSNFIFAHCQGIVDLPPITAISGAVFIM
jgi:hypothetical protein